MRYDAIDSYSYCKWLEQQQLLFTIFHLLVKVKSKLRGHNKRITGLAFSHVLNVLVSSGADAQVIIFQLDVLCVVAVLSCFSFLIGISPGRCSVIFLEK